MTGSQVSQNVGKQDLRPGDVLLSYGRNSVSRLVRGIAGGKYSHAALFCSDQCIIEADLTNGIVKGTLAAEMEAQRYVDVYRWRTLPPPPHKQLDSTGYSSADVTAVGAGLLDGQLEFDRLEALLLAAVVVISERIEHPWIRRAVRLVLSWLSSEVDSRKVDNAKICTETVCDAFWNADTSVGRKYAIYIDLAAAGSCPLPIVPGIASPPLSAGAHAVRQLDSLQSEAADLLARATSKRRPQSLLPSGAGAVRTTTRPSSPGVVQAGGKIETWQVTPHDLEHSPSLVCIGRLSEQPAKPLPWDRLGLVVRILGLFGILKEP